MRLGGNCYERGCAHLAVAVAVHAGAARSRGLELSARWTNLSLHRMVRQSVTNARRNYNGGRALSSVVWARGQSFITAWRGCR
jgi:hypothetical protein